MEAGRFFASVFVVLGLVSGCQLGPSAVRIGHSEYNEAIQYASAEQLLLNLVRLKYRESPLVLDVGSISAQFEVAQGFGIGATLNENVGQALSGVTRDLSGGAGGTTLGIANSSGRLTGRNPDALNLNGQFSYAERPTVTYTPLQGEDFVQRMLTPINLSTLITLANSGWRIDRVLSLVAQELNGLDNVSAASGPTPEIAPAFAEFLQAIELMQDLQNQRAIWFESEEAIVELSEPVPADSVTPDVALHAASANARFRPLGDGTQVVLTRRVEVPVFRMTVNEQSADKLHQLRELLRLSPDQDRYEMVAARTPAAHSARNNGRFTRIVVETRSLLGVMFYLSHGIESPFLHVRGGLVTQTFDADGQPFDWSVALGHLLSVRASMFPPADGFLAVRRRGYWYYISDSDLNSKSTFLLLAQLFSLRAGARSGGSAPVLTLPVGG